MSRPIFKHGQRVRLGCGTVVHVHSQRAGLVRCSNAATGAILSLPVAVLLAGDRLLVQGPPMQLVNQPIQVDLFPNLTVFGGSRALPPTVTNR